MLQFTANRLLRLAGIVRFLRTRLRMGLALCCSTVEVRRCRSWASAKGAARDVNRRQADANAAVGHEYLWLISSADGNGA